MNILALDLGTKTGWALSENGRIESGVQVFDTKRGESPGMRYLRFNRWLGDFYRPVADLTPTLIVYEQAHHRGGAATEILSGMVTRVLEFCARHDIEHAAVHSATLKKWTTGSGRADKGAMATHAMLRGWLTPHPDRAWDDNEVDALALLHFALAELVPEEEAG